MKPDNLTPGPWRAEPKAFDRAVVAVARMRRSSRGFRWDRTHDAAAREVLAVLREGCWEGVALAAKARSDEEAGEG